MMVVVMTWETDGGGFFYCCDKTPIEREYVRRWLAVDVVVVVVAASATKRALGQRLSA